MIKFKNASATPNLIVDGGGSGSHTTLQAAIDALGSTTDISDFTKKGWIHVKKGVYALGATGITIPTGVNGIKITTDGYDAVSFTYSGSGYAFDCGTGSDDRRFLDLSDIQITATSAAAGCMRLRRVIDSSFRNIRFSGATTGVGLLLDGTSHFTGNNYFYFMNPNNNLVGMRLTGDLTGAAPSNANFFFGCDINGSLIANAIGIDMIDGHGNDFFGCDVSNCVKGINFDGSHALKNSVHGGYSEANTTSIVFASGSDSNMVVGHANVSSNTTWYTDAGTNNTIITRDATKLVSPNIDRKRLLQPTGSIATTFDYAQVAGTDTAANTSARPYGYSVGLFKDELMTTITFYSGTTAGASLANQWFFICDSTGLVLAKTADDTSTAWGANSAKTLTITGGPYRIPSTGLYYLGYMVKATTVPSYIGMPYGRDAASSIQPLRSFVDNVNTALTNPASCPSSVTLSAKTGSFMLGYVS